MVIDKTTWHATRMCSSPILETKDPIDATHTHDSVMQCLLSVVRSHFSFNGAPSCFSPHPGNCSGCWIRAMCPPKRKIQVGNTATSDEIYLHMPSCSSRRLCKSHGHRAEAVSNQTHTSAREHPPLRNTFFQVCILGQVESHELHALFLPRLSPHHRHHHHRFHRYHHYPFVVQYECWMFPDDNNKNMSTTVYY